MSWKLATLALYVLGMPMLHILHRDALAAAKIKQSVAWRTLMLMLWPAVMVLAMCAYTVFQVAVAIALFTRGK